MPVAGSGCLRPHRGLAILALLLSNVSWLSAQTVPDRRLGTLRRCEAIFPKYVDLFGEIKKLAPDQRGFFTLQRDVRLAPAPDGFLKAQDTKLESDAWGRPFEMELADSGLRLWSWGPDGKKRTPDDIWCSDKHPTPNEREDPTAVLTTVPDQVRDWAHTRAEAYDTFSFSDSRTKRDSRGWAEAMVAIDTVLRRVLGVGAPTPSYSRQLMAVVRNHDAIWNSEQLDRTALSALTTRLRALTAEDLGRWRATLSTIEGQDIGDVWTAVIIASCDRLFDGTAVARPDAATVAERVEGLSHGMVSELSAALGISNAEAALQLATVDWFYDVDSVASRSQRVALAIAEVKSLRQAVLRH